MATEVVKSVLACDPGRNFGLAIWQDGQIRTESVCFDRKAHGEVLWDMARYLDSRISECQPDVVAYELPTPRNMKSARLQYGMTGEIERLCWRLQIACLPLHPRTIKAHATKYGAASKSDMIAAANRQGWDVADDHEADACWLAHMVVTRAEIGDAAWPSSSSPHTSPS